MVGSKCVTTEYGVVKYSATIVLHILDVSSDKFISKLNSKVVRNRKYDL